MPEPGLPKREPPSKDKRPFNLSPSTRSVLDGLPKQRPVTSWAIVRGLFALHPEYGGGRGRELARRPGPTSVLAKTVPGWLGKVEDLLEPSRVDVLHGRVMILALARIDRELGHYLAAEGVLEALQRELREDFESLLRPRPGGGSRFPPDPAPLHVDNPAADDQLGRRSFARALATRLNRVWNEYSRSAGRSSFVLHLHGPWGAGKTSLLNLLKEELQNPSRSRRLDPEEGESRIVSRWVVVELNAWQNQRLDPPWWPLLNAVFRQSAEQMPRGRAFQLRAAEIGWRLWVGRRDVLAAAGILLVLAPILYWTLQKLGMSFLQALQIKKDDVERVSTFMSVIGTALSASLVLGRSLLSGSARSAQAFVELTADPLESISRHFRTLVTRIDRPIAVFIDDLDRCQKTYVVRLLEGIQTLFNDSRVIYVLAADRRWIHTCFEKTYEDFAETVNEPGRRLGSLFLEKAVQLSVSVPRLSPELKAAYWDFLLQGENGSEKAVEALRQEVARELSGVETEGEVFEALGNAAADADPVRQQIRRQVAVERLSGARAERSTEVFLQPFAPLLDPNPRSMKRFVNSYALHRDLAVLAGLDILDVGKRQQLALWNIISLRWPLLEEHLVELAANPLAEPSPEIRTLLDSDPVRAVMEGRGVGTGLDIPTIGLLAGLRGSEGGAGTVA